jgi:hypothetical protein
MVLFLTLLQRLQIPLKVSLFSFSSKILPERPFLIMTCIFFNTHLLIQQINNFIGPAIVGYTLFSFFFKLLIKPTGPRCTFLTLQI